MHNQVTGWNDYVPVYETMRGEGQTEGDDRRVADHRAFAAASTPLAGLSCPSGADTSDAGSGSVCTGNKTQKSKLNGK